MSRKFSTKAARHAVEMHSNQLEFIEEILARGPDARDDGQVLYNNKSFDYWEGRLDQAVVICGSTLHFENCYYGFNYVDSKGNWLIANPDQYITKHPEYRDWRVRYYTRG